LNTVQNQTPTDTFELVTLASGVRSLRSVRHGETFHPVVGPMAEARELHVGQQRMVERARAEAGRAFVVWDVGLGAAANALAVLEVFCGDGAVELHSFDRTTEPLEFALGHAAELGYFDSHEEIIGTLLRDRMVRCGNLIWRLHLADFRERVNDPSIPAPHAVMFDPYSPAANPELWNLETFAAIRRRVTEDCTLTSYSRSTAVRTTLLLAGWFVGRGGATGEKDETTIAASRLELLAAPLEVDWLERVRRSTAAGPKVAAELAEHPQFGGTHGGDAPPDS
jgi:hypothetical protein